MLICKVFLRIFIHEVTNIITIDCLDIQISCKTLRAKREVLKNEKCTWSSRGCICSNFYFTDHLLTVSLKRKTNNICFIIRRMTPEKRARAVGILRQGAGIRQESRFFPENVYKSRPPADKCRCLR